MTQQSQPLDLDAIDARANAATPGPWHLHDDWPGRVFSDDQFSGHIARFTGTRPEANAALAAWSRDGVPALVAEIRRLRAELQQAQQQLRLIDDEIEEFEAAAQSDPNTPASVLLMIQILRRIRPAAVSGA